MKIIPCIQYSAAWWQAKRGIPSVSCAPKIITAAKGDLSDSAIDYACDLYAQSITPGDYWLEGLDVQSTAMANGSIFEGEARRYLSMLRDCEIPEVGFVLNDDGTAGCSPDGWYKYEQQQRGVEIKCPNLNTHCRYLLEGILPREYKPQVHFSLAVTGCEAWDFISYCRNIDPLVVTVWRNSYTDKVATAIQEFAEMYRGVARMIQS